MKDGKNTQQNTDPSYVFCILLVKKLTVEELESQILKKNRLPIEKSKQKIAERFFDMREIVFTEIKVDLLCKLTYTMIQHPARGEHCEHIDCFNLKYFL